MTLKQIYFFIFIISSIQITLLAQQSNIVNGRIVEYENEKEIPLAGVNVYWLNSQIGTSTDKNGKFSIERINNQNKLVATYIGYNNDTIIVNSDSIKIVLKKQIIELDDVTVTYHQKGINISNIEPLKLEKINEKEFLKAACCNLSESFETNPSVDVSFNDAITGTKQIQMLGLSGSYILITRENIPDFKGLSSIYGLTYIPGVWINSILLNKGTGSVINGFESISGQIDVQLKKPKDMDRFYLNAYGNADSRFETNLLFKNRSKKYFNNAVFMHFSTNNMRFDKNNDGFMDIPLSKQLNLLNRTDYNNDQGLHFETGIQALYSENTGGQMNFNKLQNKGSDSIWGMHSNNYRIAFWSKLGKTNINKPWRSYGIQFSVLAHKQNSYYGIKIYDGIQRSYYLNVIYQDIIFNTNNKFKTGITLSDDKFYENIDSFNYKRKEYLLGLFYEYSYNYLEKLTFVVGLRADYHFVYGIFITPRIHLKYAILPNLILRSSLGKGLRTSSIFSENISLFASSRQLIIKNYNDNLPYGLKPEVAWNYGINLTYNYTLDYRQGSISIDLYRTDFKEQVVLNLDDSPQKAIISNLEGKSFSNSLQFQIDYELIKRLDVRFAYRLYDVRTTYSGILRKKPLTSKHRFFVNSEYNTINHWKFDLTLNVQGPKRIPNTSSNPSEYQFEEYSPLFCIVNTQVSKSWQEKFDIYLGVENLFNYKQQKIIIAADNPFGKYFDSSLVWGPVFGRNIYFGIRFRIK
jgi:outer membrane receptor for ferrienterochelin and colicin